MTLAAAPAAGGGGAFARPPAAAACSAVTARRRVRRRQRLLEQGAEGLARAGMRGEHERRARALGVVSVGRHAGVEQHSQRGDPVVFSSEVERRPPSSVARAVVGAALEQQAEGTGPSAVRVGAAARAHRVVERAAAAAVLRLGVRSTVDEHLEGLHRVGGGGGVARGAPPCVAGVGVGATARSADRLGRVRPRRQLDRQRAQRLPPAPRRRRAANRSRGRLRATAAWIAPVHASRAAGSAPALISCSSTPVRSSPASTARCSGHRPSGPAAASTSALAASSAEGAVVLLHHGGGAASAPPRRAPRSRRAAPTPATRAPPGRGGAATTTRRREPPAWRAARSADGESAGARSRRRGGALRQFEVVVGAARRRGGGAARRRARRR